MPAETMIRVPGALRDKVRAEAAKRGITQAALIELSLRELDQAEFLRQVAATDWSDSVDEARENAAWDGADLAQIADAWDAPR